MATLTVGSHSTYATIAAAMGFANPLDTISLEAGYSNETTTVNVNNITITGQSSSTGINLSLAAGILAVTLGGEAPINVDDNSSNNVLTGNDGANILGVSSGADVVHGGLGEDTLKVDYSTATADIIGSTSNITDGGTRSVTYDGIENFNIHTGTGDDTLTVGNGTNSVFTNTGNDTITAGDGANIVRGGAGNDTITVGNGHNSIMGQDGNDTVTAGDGGNSINGGEGDNNITSGAGADGIKAGLGNDTIASGGGNDLIFVTGGNDHIDAGAGTDTIDYSLSSLGVVVSLATVSAQTVNTIAVDTVISVENINGSTLHDRLTGGTGNNIINGNGGQDTLTGGHGADTITGGAGTDRFVYTSAADSTGSNHDTVVAFNAYSDRFDVPGTVSGVDTAVVHGALSPLGFNGSLAADINSSNLAAHHAVEFTPDSGSLAGRHFLIVDVNGVAGYQANADLVIQLDTPGNISHLGVGNFI